MDDSITVKRSSDDLDQHEIPSKRFKSDASSVNISINSTASSKNEGSYEQTKTFTPVIQNEMEDAMVEVFVDGSSENDSSKCTIEVEVNDSFKESPSVLGTCRDDEPLDSSIFENPTLEKLKEQLQLESYKKDLRIKESQSVFSMTDETIISDSESITYETEQRAIANKSDDDIKIVSEVIAKPVTFKSISEVLSLYPNATIIPAKGFTTPLSMIGKCLLQMPSTNSNSTSKTITNIDLDSSIETVDIEENSPEKEDPKPVPLSFNWDDYLKKTESEASPETSFIQIEKCMDYAVKPGQIFEIVKKLTLPEEYVKESRNHLASTEKVSKTSEAVDEKPFNREDSNSPKSEKDEPLKKETEMEVDDKVAKSQPIKEFESLSAVEMKVKTSDIVNETQNPNANESEKEISEKAKAECTNENKSVINIKDFFEKETKDETDLTKVKTESDLSDTNHCDKLCLVEKSDIVVNSKEANTKKECSKVTLDSAQASLLPEEVAAGDQDVETFWPVEVLQVCGSLLRVQYLLPSNLRPSPFWCDIKSEDCRQYGYGKQNKLIPCVPDKFDELCLSLRNFPSKNNENSLPNMIDEFLESLSFKSLVAEETFCASSAQLWQRIPEGAAVEVLNPSAQFGWPARVIKNNGGRLLLEYFSAEYGEFDEKMQVKEQINSPSNEKEVKKEEEPNLMCENDCEPTSSVSGLPHLEDFDKSLKEFESKSKSNSSEESPTDNDATANSYIPLDIGSSQNDHFFMFCTDIKLRNIGYVKNSKIYSYSHPTSCKDPTSDNFIDKIGADYPSVTTKLPICGTVDNELTLKSDSFDQIREGDLLEILHPKNLDSIHKARVSLLYKDTKEVEVEYSDNCAEFNIAFRTGVNDYKLLANGFSLQHGLKLTGSSEVLDSESNPLHEQSEKGKEPITKECFRYRSEAECEFSVGEKLEIEHKLHPSVLCVGTVVKITEHLVWIEYDVSDELIDCSENCKDIAKLDVDSPKFLLNCFSKSMNIIVLPVDSDKIFPTGWAMNNGTTLAIPFSCDESSSLSNSNNFLSPKREKYISVCDPVSAISSDSSFCPEMILNYRCFPGPFLSKLKLSYQTGVAIKGNIRSVLTQVVSQTLGASFCQGKLTKDIVTAFEEASANRTCWQSLPIKAKLKRFSVRSSIMAPLFMKDFHVFMKTLFGTLQCCPNLWSFSKFEQCPYKCKQSSPQLLVDKHFNALLLSPKKRQSSTSLLGNQFDDEEDNDRELEMMEMALTVKTEKTELVEPVIPVEPKRNVMKRLFAFEPIAVDTDPLQWSVHEVYDYISKQPSVSHHAAWLKSHQIDGEALMLLDLQSLLCYSRQPHSSILPLAHQLCRLKMSHVLMRNEKMATLEA